MNKDNSPKQNANLFKAKTLEKMVPQQLELEGLQTQTMSKHASEQGPSSKHSHVEIERSYEAKKVNRQNSDN